MAQTNMTQDELNKIIRLAAKDALVKMYKWDVPNWTEGRWNDMLDWQIGVIMSLPRDEIMQLISIYQRKGKLE